MASGCLMTNMRDGINCPDATAAVKLKNVEKAVVYITYRSTHNIVFAAA